MTNSGEDGVLSTSNDGAHQPGNDAYYYYEGTSMATPHVAGVAALMFARNPSLTPNQVLARMRSNAKLFPTGNCPGCGAGIVDAYWSAAMATATVVTETESNNTRATAQAITPTTAAVSGTISSTSDVDYFKVSLAAGKQLRASLAPTSTTRDFDLYLYNSNGTLLRKSDRSTGQTDRIVYDNTGATTLTLYVKVAYYAGGTGGYTLSIKH
jgi:serine protease